MVSRLSARTSRTLIAAALAACFAAPAFASGTDYYVVVPMPGKVASAPASPITVTLNAYALPAGMVTQAYDFNLNAVLQVTGDSAFNPAQVTWTLVSGTCRPVSR